MQYQQLGARGPRVSIVGMGCRAIGGMDWGATDDNESLAALHQALDGGVTLLDTADVYGRGHSEELIARVLRDRGADGVVIATKAGNDFYHATEEDNSGYGPIRQSAKRPAQIADHLAAAARGAFSADELAVFRQTK